MVVFFTILSLIFGVAIMFFLWDEFKYTSTLDIIYCFVLVFCAGAAAYHSAIALLQLR